MMKMEMMTMTTIMSTTVTMMIGGHTDFKLEMYPRNNTAQHAKHNHTMLSMIKRAHSCNLYVAFCSAFPKFKQEFFSLVIFSGNLKLAKKNMCIS